MLLLASTLFVFHPIVFSGFTLGQNMYTIDTERRYVDDQLPVLDPLATGLQDEPWLYFIRSKLSAGKLPLVNLRNGLGAPFLESLQPGVFYLLNPLLLLLPGESTRTLDWFTLIHVMVLVVGLFLLLRLYARREIALCVALLVAFSGVTYHHLNMVHYRGFVWLPLMLYGGIRLGRGDRSVGAFAALAFATLAAATAGNLQDFVMSAMTFSVICAGDVLLSPQPGKWRRLALTFLGFGGLVCAAAPAFLPYLASLRDENLASAGSAPRCLASVPGVAFATWLLPAANGRLLNQQLIEGLLSFDHQLDLPTSLTLFVCAGLLVLVRHGRQVAAPRRGMMVLLSLFLVLSVAKLLHVRVFDFCASLPLIQGMRFTKYVLHLSIVVALLAALSLEALVSLEPARRRAVVRSAAVVTFLAVVGLLVAQRVGSTWHAPVDNPARRSLYLVWGASLGLLLLASVLLHQRRRIAWAMFAVAILFQAVLCRPNGYFGYLDTARPTSPALADRGMTGGKRMLTSTLANSNLLWDFEEVGVFDPIHNRVLAALLSRYFPLHNPGFHIQVGGVPLSLSATQFDVLRFLGVDALEAGAFRPPVELPLRDGLYLIPDALPRAFLLSETSAAEVEVRCAAGEISGALSVIRRGLETQGGLSTSVRTNGLRLQGWPGEGRHVLIVNQAYSTAWRYQGSSGRKFCGVFPAWNVEGGSGASRDVRYWPVGLTPALGVSALALAAWLAGAVYLRRRSSGGVGPSGVTRGSKEPVREGAARVA